MKQHFQPHVPARTAVMLSLEEEAIVMTELADSNGAIDADLVAVDRATDVAKGVEDVEVIMGNINNVDDTCAALIAAVGEMGVVGTDADPEEIMPDNVTPEMLEVATESEEGNGKNVVARLKETLKKIWNGIMELLKTAWENIKKFTSGIFDYLQNCKAQCVDLRTKINHLSKIKEGGAKGPISINDPYHFLLDRKGNGGGERIDVSERYMQSVFTDGTRHVAKIGLVLNDSLKSFSPNDVAKWESQTTSVVTAIVQQLAAVLTAKPAGGSPSEGDDKVLAHGAEVLGAWRMSVYGKAVAFTGEGPEQTEALSQIRFRPGPSMTSEGHTVEYPEPFPLDLLKQLLAQSEKMIDHLFYLQRGEGARVLKTGVDSIQRSGEEAIAKLGNAVSGTAGNVVEDDNYAKAALNRVMRLGSAYGNWASSPLKEIAHRSVMFINMEINIVRKMMQYYE